MGNLTGTELKRLHRDWRRRTDANWAIALDGVQGPFNVGSIIRTAAAYRVGHLFLTEQATGPEHPKVDKTALGTARYCDVVRHPTMAEVADDAHSRGYRLVGVELAHDAVPLHELDLRGDVCLVVGHEDRGLSSGTADRCDALGYLPQLGRVGSLNVATAAAIAIYEIHRQNWTAAT